MKKLSIIVPVLNTEKYLSKCLESLLDQDMPAEDYEVIIIDDGSTDASSEIARSYMNRYHNFTLLIRERTGVGASRNEGINQSSGKYLFFVDSDDYLQPNCLSSLLRLVEANDLDVLRFNYWAVNENGLIIPKKKNSTNSTVYSEKVVDGETFLTDYLGWACYTWSFIFKASFLKSNNLNFNPIIYFEDVEWLLRVLSLAERVQSVDRQVYVYQQRSGSITQSVTTDKKNKILSDKLFILDFLKAFSLSTQNKNVRMWCNGMISLTIMGVLAFVENELPARKQEIIDSLYVNRLFPLKSFRFTLKQKRDLLLINIHPLLYCLLKKKK